MGFIKPQYKTIKKTIDGVDYRFAIPSSFCEYPSVSNKVFQFVKCYDIELEKAGWLNYFSERILIAVEEDDKKLKNISDRIFAKIRKENYDKLSKDIKESFFFNETYPLKNKYGAKVYNDKYIYNRVGYDDNERQFNTFEAGLFLDKRYFMINWTQYLYKGEPLLNIKKFDHFLEENRKNNENDSIQYNFGGKKIIISKPKFGHYVNYTDIASFNIGNFNGIFVSLIDDINSRNVDIFKVSLIPSNITTEKVFKDMASDEYTKDLIKYKGVNFIKVTRSSSIMYICYVNFSDNMTGLLGFEIMHDNSDAIKKIYKYREQLISENL